MHPLLGQNFAQGLDLAGGQLLSLGGRCAARLVNAL
jgi:hypothetical protein